MTERRDDRVLGALARRLTRARLGPVHVCLAPPLLRIPVPALPLLRPRDLDDLSRYGVELATHQED